MAKILRMLLFLSTPSARRATRIRTAFHLDPEKFLSTPSARRATWFLRSPPAMRANFYPRPPRGGRQPAYLRQHQDERISIHALREEGDQR